MAQPSVAQRLMEQMRHVGDMAKELAAAGKMMSKGGGKEKDHGRGGGLGRGRGHDIM